MTTSAHVQGVVDDGAEEAHVEGEEVLAAIENSTEGHSEGSTAVSMGPRGHYNRPGKRAGHAKQLRVRRKCVRGFAPLRKKLFQGVVDTPSGGVDAQPGPRQSAPHPQRHSHDGERRFRRPPLVPSMLRSTPKLGLTYGENFSLSHLNGKQCARECPVVFATFSKPTGRIKPSLVGRGGKV